MAKFQDSMFSDTSIELDGNQYLGCTFHRCEFIFRGTGTFVFGNNNLSDCRWKFEDAALRTMNFMKDTYHAGEWGKELIEATFNSIRAPRK